MFKLIRGIQSFRSGPFAERKELFEKLGGGQNPETLFITCSDSRIDPCLLTQTEPGELFVIRNAGNIVPPHGRNPGGEAATIEYAVAALGVRNIVVCGHSQCGAMQGLLQPEALDDMPAVAGWLDHSAPVRRIIRDHYADLPDDRKLMAAVQENVLAQLANLLTLPSVAAAEVRGELGLHGWVYRFETGEVYCFQPKDGRFEPLTEDLVLPVASITRRGPMSVI